MLLNYPKFKSTEYANLSIEVLNLTLKWLTHEFQHFGYLNKKIGIKSFCSKSIINMLTCCLFQVSEYKHWVCNFKDFIFNCHKFLTIDKRIYLCYESELKAYSKIIINN